MALGTDDHRIDLANHADRTHRRVVAPVKAANQGKNQIAGAPRGAIVEGDAPEGIEAGHARAEMDRSRAEMDRTPAEMDRTPAEMDRTPAGEDKIRAEEDRIHAGEDRIHAGEDRIRAGEDRIRVGEDRTHSEDGSNAVMNTPI
ncbi:MAG: hypothetical protein GY854_12015 [Deltaproteobacteria bacterium]|nr:hypothetical protein [Deltaproteobacteria bacterium]